MRKTEGGRASYSPDMPFRQIVSITHWGLRYSIINGGKRHYGQNNIKYHPLERSFSIKPEILIRYAILLITLSTQELTVKFIKIMMKIMW